MRVIEWGVKKNEKWCAKRKVTVGLKTASPTYLSEILRNFFDEKKTEKGQALTPSAFTEITAAIYRYLTCTLLRRKINILQDIEFMSAHKICVAKAKLCTHRSRANDATRATKINYMPSKRHVIALYMIQTV